MGPSTISWGLMTNTTAITRSTSLSLFMYVMSLKCYFGAFDEEMVVSLTRLTLTALENTPKFSFAVAYLECVSGGKRNLRIS